MKGKKRGESRERTPTQPQLVTAFSSPICGDLNARLTPPSSVPVLVFSSLSLATVARFLQGCLQLCRMSLALLSKLVVYGAM